MERSLGNLNSTTTRRTFLSAAGAAGLAAGAYACAPAASPQSPAAGGDLPTHRPGKGGMGVGLGPPGGPGATGR